MVGVVYLRFMWWDIFVERFAKDEGTVAGAVLPTKSP